MAKKTKTKKSTPKPKEEKKEVKKASERKKSYDELKRIRKAEEHARLYKQPVFTKSRNKRWEELVDSYKLSNPEKYKLKQAKRELNIPSSFK